MVYDNTIFESVTFANLNNWDKPDYNETNGSFLTSKGDFVKNDEDVFIISLKLKSDAKLGDTKVQLKDIQVADLDKEYTSTGAEITIKVVEKSITDDDKETQTTTEIPITVETEMTKEILITVENQMTKEILITVETQMIRKALIMMENQMVEVHKTVEHQQQVIQLQRKLMIQ